MAKSLSFASLLLFLFACLTIGCGRYNPLASDREWRFQRTTTGEWCYESARLYLPCDDPISKMELELVKGPESVRMYLNLLNDEVELADCEERTEVIVTIDGFPSSHLASVFEGNQRLLLPVPASELILQGLLSHQCVEIQVGRNSLEITSQGFTTGYERMCEGTDPILTWDNAWRLCGIER